ncbi:MAG: hypothetical protein ACI4C4_14015 [Lachnospiraceae bacterium]
MGGNWTSIVDKPHFQITYDYSVYELYEKYSRGEVVDGYVVLE